MTPPTGTVTFLFTDIEGSTRLWEQHPQAMRDALARHDFLMHQAIAAHGGIVFKTMGDAFCAAFHTASQALLAAFTAQRSLQNETWPDPVTINVRMALHTGTADERDGDYFGPPLNRVARLLSTGYGGQTLLSQPTYELTRDALPLDCSLLDLGAHSLRDLARPEQVYQLCHPTLSRDFPPLKSLDSLPNNLPQQMTSFIGRERELAVVKDLLAKSRLLTLTGSGGCGKTRLSLQAAADVLDLFPDGVWLVELAPITDPGLVPRTVANVLSLKEQPGKTYSEALAQHLKTKTLLLVLDNCEHVLAASAALVADLLRACPNVKVLASSREALNVTGEQTYRVPSLSLPNPKQTATPESLSQYEAVRLFIDRALLVKPDFAVTNQNAPALASVCHRVDGIPLALELAAARVRSLSVEEINSKLDNRFRLLTGGARTSLPRQQTLRALIDWSYDLLTEQEKSLFIRLSVFVGGWTLSAAEAVCISDEIEDWEVLDLLTSLVDKSLVYVEEMDGQSRYGLLETVRQYARDRLAESQDETIFQDRHSTYFLTVATEKFDLSLAQQKQWLDQMHAERSNLRAALVWLTRSFALDIPIAAQTEPHRSGLKLASIFGWYCEARGYLSEGRIQLEAALATVGAQEPTLERASALSQVGTMTSAQGNFLEARPWLEESLAIFKARGYQRETARVLIELSGIAKGLSDLGQARALQEQSLELQREIGDINGIAISLTHLGGIAWTQGNLAEAQALQEQSLVLFREMDNQSGIITVLIRLGNLATTRGDYAAAQAYYQEGLVPARALGQKVNIAYLLVNLGGAFQGLGDYGGARQVLEESLMLFRQMDHKTGIAGSLLGIGQVAFRQMDYPRTREAYAESLAMSQAQGNRAQIAKTLDQVAALQAAQSDMVHAVRLWGAAESIRKEIGAPLSEIGKIERDQTMSKARTALRDTAFDMAWDEGRALSWEQAVEYALGENAELP